MPRLFNRILSFEIQGEIYDNETKPEDIIKNYDFHFKDYNDIGSHCYLTIEHKDHRGRITRISNRPRVEKAKKPDTEYLLI